MKTSGAEFKLFYNDPVYWKPPIWHCDSKFKLNGNYIDEEYDLNSFKDTDVVEFTDGFVYFDEDETEENSIGFVQYFKKWKKEQTEMRLVVFIQKDDLDKFKEYIKQFKNAKII